MIIVRIAVYTSAYVALNFELLSVGIRANGTLKRRRKNISKRSVIRVLHNIILSFTKCCPLYIYIFFFEILSIQEYKKSTRSDEREEARLPYGALFLKSATGTHTRRIYKMTKVLINP